MDISSLNAFLHATSKPVQSNGQNCFDRLPQTMNQLIVQCLFPVRQADESPMYRFMRAQIVQSRQASYHGVLQILYQGGRPADVQADIEWKNGIDHACIETQRVIARSLFSDFYRRPLFFPHDSTRDFFSPSPTFNQFPYITLLQRISDRYARRFQERGLDDQYLLEGMRDQLSAGFHLTNHAGLRLLLADPKLHVHMKERIRHIAEQPVIFVQLQQNTPIPRKVRFVAGCIAIASVIYSVSRAVYSVFRAILPILIISFVVIFLTLGVVECTTYATQMLMQTPIALKRVTQELLKTSTTNIQRVILIVATLFKTIAFAMLVFSIGCGISKMNQIISLVSAHDWRLGATTTLRKIEVEFSYIRSMLLSLLKQRTQLAQWILLRRRTPAAQA